MATRRGLLGLGLLILGASTAGLSTSCLSVRAEGPPAAAVAPAFSLKDHRGQTVSLAQITANGPAVLVFYRGYW